MTINELRRAADIAEAVYGLLSDEAQEAWGALRAAQDREWEDGAEERKAQRRTA